MRRPLALILHLCMSSSLLAGVGDPTLRTDHPHYPGEGAFQTAADCVAFATGNIKGEQERAIAVFQWLLAHQFHLHSPQECFVPGIVPGARNDDYEMVVYDAGKARFSYGYGLCGTVHAWNEVYWNALGMKARRRAFPGHTNSEIFYGGGWHAFDTDMAGLVFRKDGVVAGYEDVVKDPSIVGPNDRGLPHYPFAWPADFNGMKQGWNEVAKKPDGWYKMYHSGYEALPGIVNLRRGETFTRYFDRDHFGGPGKRRFWHVQKGAPFRDWTFVNNGTPVHTAGRNPTRAATPPTATPSLSTRRTWARMPGVRGPSTRPLAASHNSSINPRGHPVSSLPPPKSRPSPSHTSRPTSSPATRPTMKTR